MLRVVVVLGALAAGIVSLTVILFHDQDSRVIAFGRPVYSVLAVPAVDAEP